MVLQTNQTPEKEFEVISLPLSEFQYYFRGLLVEDHTPLDLASIKTLGIQTFVGVYDDFEQSGVSTLEIDTIYAV